MTRTKDASGSANPGAGVPLAAAKTSILIVEDSRIQAEALRRLLVREGFAVTVAGNGVEGLTKVRELRPDIVITDILMPEMDGYELCRRIKDEEGIRDTPVIILTTLAEPENIIRGLECGADNFLTKPYREDFVLSRISYIIANRFLRTQTHMDMGFEIVFAGKKYFITSNRFQILDLLISSFETAVYKNCELEKRTQELSTLFELSSAISLTTDLNQLFRKFFETMAGSDAFNVLHRGVVFLVENNGLSPVYHVGMDAPSCVLAGNLQPKAEECLCGLAARTGELVVSACSRKDCRHSVQLPDAAPHGNFIIPLKANVRIVGVLCIYTMPDAQLDDRSAAMLLTVGTQIGMAIENVRLLEESRRLALHDPLTGLANRRYVDVVLDKYVAGLKRNESPLSAAILDIDHFKQYNDTFGHTSGDRLLVSLAEVLLHTVREMDTVARYGGEEFLVLLPETDLENASTTAERIRKAVEEIGITVSLGVAEYRKGMTKDAFITKADDAMYQAKHNGRNRVEMGL